MVVCWGEFTVGLLSGPAAALLLCVLELLAGGGVLEGWGVAAGDKAAPGML